jgi:hypothetical protein
MLLILGPKSTFIFPNKLISISTTTKYLINTVTEAKVNEEATDPSVSIGEAMVAFSFSFSTKFTLMGSTALIISLNGVELLLTIGMLMGLFFKIK